MLEKMEKLMLYPSMDADQSQNVLDSSIGHTPPTQQVSWKSFHNFLSNHTRWQISKSENIASFFGGSISAGNLEVIG